MIRSVVQVSVVALSPSLISCLHWPPAVKNAADRFQMEADESETSKIKEPHQLYEFANKHMHLPYKHIFDKKGHAIFRRHFYCDVV